MFHPPFTMGKKVSTVASRAWRILRLSLHWTLKPRATNARPRASSVVPKRGGYCEFSFDETPSFQFKKRRRSASLCFFPCVAPSVQEDKHEEFDEFLSDEDEEEEVDSDSQDSWSLSPDVNGKVECEIEEIDSLAEKFIREFYERIERQRHISPSGNLHGMHRRRLSF